MGAQVGALTVRAVAYHVSATRITAVVIHPDGTTEHEDLGPVQHHLPAIDAVVDALQRTIDVARGKVRALRTFAESSGRPLLPRSITADPPDVLVIIPHSLLHGIPLHLVYTDAGEPLCVAAAVTYASGISQFVQCVAGNPARFAPLDRWTIGTDRKPSRYAVSGYCADVLGGQDQRFQAVIDHIESALGYPTSPKSSRGDVKQAMNPRNPRTTIADALVLVVHGYLDRADHQRSGLLMSAGEQLTPEFGAVRTLGLRLATEQPDMVYPDAALARTPAELQIARFAELLSIAELRMDTLCRIPLIALFGCSAGWARVLKGDLPSSFAEAFLTLGASTVIAPAWDCEVEASARWGERFFEAWSRFGWPAALSGAYASRTLYEDSVPMEHFGAFTLRGDWL